MPKFLALALTKSESGEVLKVWLLCFSGICEGSCSLPKETVRFRERDSSKAKGGVYTTDGKAAAAVNAQFF